MVDNECQRKETLSASEYPTFEEFKEKCKKNYESEEEEKRRKIIYERNVDQLSIYEDAPYKVGVNCRSDRTAAEMTSKNELEVSSS